MSDLSSLPPLRDVIDAYGLRAKKSLGQNFLLDLNLTRKIVRKAGDLNGCHVIEVGPGPGGLTRAILESEAEKVYAVEFDARAVKALQELVSVAPGRLDVIEADALALDLVQSVAQGPRVIIANLPYNIATPLLISWLKQIHADQSHYRSMTLMFQKEVAQRVTATPGEKAFGRLAVLAQWLCHCTCVMDLPPQAFTPPPKVTSSVVHFEPKLLNGEQPSFEAVEAVTAAAFGQRRKMIRSSLKGYTDKMNELGLNSELRAEDLHIDDFINLAR